MPNHAAMQPDPAQHPEQLSAIAANLARRGDEISQDLADLSRTNAQSTEPDLAAAAAIGTAFERVAQATRRSILLCRHLAEHTVESEPDMPPEQQRAANRAEIVRDLEDAIAKSRPEADHAALYAELHEHLDTLDRLDVLPDRPVDEIIVQIRRDLGIELDYNGRRNHRRRRPADVAALLTAARTQPPPHLRLVDPAKPPTPPPPDDS